MASRKDDVLNRITVEHYDKRYIVESPYSDGNLIEDLTELTYSILLMAGYSKECINDAFRELAEEHSDEQPE